MTPTDNMLTSVSVIIPTYKEALNLPALLARLEQVRATHGLDLEAVIMDDNSRDGTVEAVAAFDRPWARVVVRTRNRGLSAAVLDGFRQAQKTVLVVMDADLSHPPETIPWMLEQLNRGADFVLGSRYVAGGSTEEKWGIWRWLNSKAATLLARPFTKTKDPMSGFFAIRRSMVEAPFPLFRPIGYKIGLELLVKCHCRHVVEIPIHFSQRHKGQSKLSFREQLQYLEHLRRLADYKFGDWARFLQFMPVMLMSSLLAVAASAMALRFGLPTVLVILVGFVVYSGLAFPLNRYLVFMNAKQHPCLTQLLWFMTASAIGVAVYSGVAMSLPLWPSTVACPVLAHSCGFLLGLLPHYAVCRFRAFRHDDIQHMSKSAGKQNP